MCVSYFTTGGPGKEHRTNKPPLTRIWERSKADVTSQCPTTSQNPSCWHPSWLSSACTTRKDPESRVIGQRQRIGLERKPVTIKPEPASHVAEQFRVPLPSCSPLGHPFAIKSLALSTHVSIRTIHFRVLDRSPLLGPGRDPPSCNHLAGMSCRKNKAKEKVNSCRGCE